MLGAIGIGIGVEAGVGTNPRSLEGSGIGAVTEPSRTAPHCVVTYGAGPGYDASIGNRENGKTICVVLGERLLVFLSAPFVFLSAPSPTSSPWHAVHVSQPGILRIVPLALDLPRGATATNFQAVHLGSVQLTSERPTCAPSAAGAPTCLAIVLWRATVVVQRSASSQSPKSPTGTGVYGLVTAGPTCPVERVDQPCPPRPVVAEIDLRVARGKTVVSTRTDGAGRFSLAVGPGRYTLIVVTSSVLPRCPSPTVTVASGRALRVDVSCDTGIR